MEFRGKNILIISPEPWNHIFVSKHHYATHLAARGNKVYFLNPPSGNISVNETKYNGVCVVNYHGFIKGIRFLPRFIQKYLLRKKFIEIERLCKTNFDVVWSFDNSVFFNFRALPSRVLKISHIVDLNQDFQLETAAKTADICLCTTEMIYQKMVKYNNKTFKLNHGYNKIQVDTYSNLPGSNEIKAVYAGNLNMKFIDWNILYDTVSTYPAVDFIFIGPNKDLNDGSNRTAHVKKKMFQMSNVYWIEPVHSDRLQQYLLAADFLLVSYQEEFHADQSNPHKMMEYLGSGKPIVATYTSEYEQQTDLITMVRSNSDFVVAFGNAVKNLDTLKSEDAVERRVQYASSHSYERQIEKIERIINA